MQHIKLKKKMKIRNWNLLEIFLNKSLVNNIKQRIHDWSKMFIIEIKINSHLDRFRIPFNTPARYYISRNSRIFKVMCLKVRDSSPSLSLFSLNRRPIVSLVKITSGSRVSNFDM